MIYIFIITAVSCILLILYIVQIYNGLVLLKHNINKAWSNIDVLLKQRHSELGKLVDVCREHMRYEADVLEKVTQARTAVASAQQQNNVFALGEAETALRQNFQQLLGVAEKYPELKAIQSFQRLGKRISTLETHIADRRELYNESVNLNNVRIKQFPDSILANYFSFKPAYLLRFSEGNIYRNNTPSN